MRNARGHKPTIAVSCVFDVKKVQLEIQKPASDSATDGS